MAWIAVVPPSPRHPYERYQDGKRQRSAGIYPAFGCRLEVEERDCIAPGSVVTAADHVDGAARHHQGGVTNLEDPSGVSEVAALGIAQLGGDPGDLPAATSLGQPIAYHQHGAWLEELSEGLGVVEHEGILQQGLQLLRGARSGRHDAA